MKIKTSDNRNISVSSVNGYSLPKVKKAKQYLDEIGQNKRTFPFARLVQMYNELKGTNDSEQGCKCQSPKYYNGIQNYFRFGKMTLIANGVATEADFEDKKAEDVIDNAENRIQVGDVATEEAKHEAMLERMAKMRAQRGKKKEQENVEDNDK